MRWVVPFLVVFGGCVATLPEDPTVSADMACETARMVVELRRHIQPTPQSDDCENCHGTGTIGDGRITKTCPVCKGSGKR